ncbi:hypothetical protein IFM89_037896 [Coptis chinensis]|uniref:Plectin/eS10 N-terminal domain-containing protein n=1 Tax=Coptis chinensis TaxID=261450 RepID=A0A835I237_9MAGN|nr:hypothetical protein IFM89_037896 [Coptis chinensis]
MTEEAMALERLERERDRVHKRWRQSMSNKRRLLVRAWDTYLRRQRRHNMTNEQRSLVREHQTNLRRLRRINTTNEQRSLQRERDHLRTRERRHNLSQNSMLMQGEPHQDSKSGEVDNLILESQVVDDPSLFLTRKEATSIYIDLVVKLGVDNLEKHPDIDVPNLQVIKLMQSFKSKEYVRETFAWMHYYWYLTNDGIEFLRTFLNLPSEIVPTTLKKSLKPPGRPMGGGDRPRGPSRFDGDRLRFGGDRDGYRGGPHGGQGDFGGDKGGAPPKFQPSFSVSVLETDLQDGAKHIYESLAANLGISTGKKQNIIVLSSTIVGY